MNGAGAGSDLNQAYLEADRELRLRLSKVGCLFAITLMPAGSSLDYFVYPELLWPIFKIRVMSVIWAAAVLGLLFTRFGRNRVRILGVAWVLVPSAAIAWMVYATEGSASPYYAGLNIAMVAVCMLMPWTFWESVVTCSIIITIYLVACMLHQNVPFNSSIFFNNIYFLTLTAIICATTCFFSARRRFDDFCLRHEIALRNRELAETNDRLAELDRLKTEFFANVSHEFRTPLMLILSPLETLLSKHPPIPDAVRHPLVTVRDNAFRLLKLINDLLELVRLEAGRTQVELMALDLRRFVPGIAESVRHLAENEGLVLQTEGPDEPLIVRADPGRLEKVLLNLLINAVKFTPRPGSITVRWNRDDRSALVEVQDTGIGIAPKDLPFVFDRFRQADGSSTRRFQGTGLGLALARELVEEQGGSLEATSKVGQGTWLRMSLPLASEEVVPAVAENSPVEDGMAQFHRAAELIGAGTGEVESAAEMQPLGSGLYTLLLVEDESDIRHFVATSMADEYQVLQASDGTTGLNMIRQHRPHLVLLDLMLPGMDGLTVCATVKNDPELAGTKVVLLTARTDEEAKIAALERGADDFLSKPFSTLELKTRVANLLRAAQLEEDLRERNTDLEEALTRLQEAEVQLVQTEKMNALGNLAAGLLHEINNPLNYTLTALQIAEASIPEGEDELQEIVHDIGEGMGRIRDIVTDLRSFAYPSRENQREHFSLAACLETAMRLVAAETAGISVVHHLHDGATVRGAKTQITHLLMNLLTNAARALRPVDEQRAATIRVSAQQLEGRLQVVVRDNGVGISAEDLTKIFNPFFTTREVGDGMGLGLSICHTIVKNHGGQISARSEPGEWTEVVFDLPGGSEEEYTDDTRL